jgi:outer membrane protein insertion porin family
MMPDRTTSRWAILRRLLASTLLPLLISGGVPARAQDPAPQLAGRTIEGIEFRGLKSLTQETLLYYLGLAPGQPLDEAQLNKKIKELWSRNLVDDVKLETLPTATGVRLVITVQERPVLRSIEYEGVKRLSKTDIQDKITTQHIRVREGEPLSLGELHRVKALIEELYAEKGYRFAQAQYHIEDVGNNEKKILFTVDEGDRVRIADISFDGNHVFHDLHLKWVMKNVKESGIISRIAKKDVYDPAKLQEDLEKVRDVYRHAGYKNVVIGDPKVEVRALHPEAKLAKDQKRRMFISIPIEEGERWKFGEVSIEGNEVYAGPTLLRVFQHKTGSWLRSKVVDDGVKQITDLYHNTGYILASVEPELVERPGNVADLVIHVHESDRYKVGRIEFQGNERTMDKVLRREIRLYEGGLVNIGAIRNSVTKVNQLGYFKLNEEDPVDIDTDTEKKKVNLTFKGDESDRTELQFGGGWSELDGFFGQFAINTKNFLGRGEQVGVSYQSGNFRDLFDVSYYIPWYLDRPQSIGLRLFKQNLDFGVITTSDLTDQRFLRNSKGAVLTYGRNFGLFTSGSLSYTRSKYEDTQQLLATTTDTGSGTVTPTTTKTTLLNSSSVRPAFLYDSRDNPFEPVRGQRLSLATEVAGSSLLGGDNYFVRPEVAYSLFLPVSSNPVQTVFAFNGEAGLVRPFGGKTLSSLERFYLGGENSIRGHRFRSIFVRDSKGHILLDQDGFALGGDKYVQFNLEYHFLLGGPFRLLLFADAGNVYGKAQGFDLSRLRYTAGTELRVMVPMFGAPLRFIYSINLKPLPEDRFENFQFSIGTSF